MYSYDYYDYGMGAGLEEFMDEFGFVILGVVLLILLVSLLVGLVFYVLQSAGFYTIAKRRGIKNPWLAWIPIGNYWIIGSISDQYRYVSRGEVKNKRKLLLILSLASLVVGLVFGIIIGVLNGLLVVGSGNSQGMLATMAAVNVARTLISGLAGVLLVVFQYMALYDIYASCAPENKVLFLVLSIIFNITIPFFVFCNRKRDDGMPPRRPEPRYIPPQESWETPEQL